MNPMNRKTLSILSFFLFAVIAGVHVFLTNRPGGYFNYTKPLLMPSLALFYVLTIRDRRRGFPILWAQAGLWLGNLCLIRGEESQLLFALGSAATILGFLGYIYIMGRNAGRLSYPFVLLQIPLVWLCAFFVILMGDSLGTMLLPVSLYMSLIGLISLTALAQLWSHPRSRGSWLMFAGSLCYIGENGLYTANHYMPSLSFGENIVHPFFIAAQTLFAVGYLLIEREPHGK
jgi:uncharacterized membrane protein YhhN